MKPRHNELMTEAEYAAKTASAGISYQTGTLALLFAKERFPDLSVGETRSEAWRLLQSIVLDEPPKTSPN